MTIMPKNTISFIHFSLTSPLPLIPLFQLYTFLVRLNGPKHPEPAVTRLTTTRLDTIPRDNRRTVMMRLLSLEPMFLIMEDWRRRGLSDESRLASTTRLPP